MRPLGKVVFNLKNTISFELVVKYWIGIQATNGSISNQVKYKRLEKLCTLTSFIVLPVSTYRI